MIAMESEVQRGQVLAGKYRVEELLGRGGMGVVMAATHLTLNQKVALKFLTKEACQLPEAVARFLREARSAVQIQSEHVARVLDFGTLESGAPYIVMEYLRGMDLKDLGQQRGPLPPSEAVDYLLQAIDAVAEAHALGIVHRDLKPSNLFITHRADGSPLVKVLDFGISKALQADSSTQLQMTASAAIMGSPQYMSPEQIRSSKNVDARADIWALGTILHELLAGSPAYTADTVPGLLATIVADPPQSLASARPDLPPGLEPLVLRCLEKDRTRRFANVAELSRSLLPFASAESRSIVGRICRLLGESERAAAPALDAAPYSATEVRPRPEQRSQPAAPAAQTNGSFARTGAERSPWYQKGPVQVGVALGAIALSVVAWLVSGSSPSDVPDTLHALPAPAAGAPAAASTAKEATAHALPVLPPVEAAPPVRVAPPETARPAPPAPATTKGPSAEPEHAESASKPRVKSSRPRTAAKPRARSAERAEAALKEPEPAARPAPSARPRKNDSALDDLFGDTK
jgi:serine/threonine-protein kinase